MNRSSDNSSTEKQGYPKGWLIKANKYLNVPNTEHEAVVDLFEGVFTSKQLPKAFTGYRDIAYGNYDRIQMLPVDTLADFNRESNQAYNWLGSTQSILLYTWKQQNEARYFMWKEVSDTGAIKIVATEPNQGERQNDFFAISFCYISDGMRSSCLGLTYQEMLDACDKHIRQLVEAFNAQLEGDQENGLHNRVLAEVFGSLSAAEIVILWSAKQYTDILYLIDCVRDFKYEGTYGDLSVFRTAYTMITFPDAVRKGRVGSWGDMVNPELSSILGESYVQFATQDGAGESSFDDFQTFFDMCIKNASLLIGEPKERSISSHILHRCAGEYDLLANIESKYLARLFNNPMNWHDRGWRFDEKKLQIKDLVPEDCACSVHHPFFNHYILYSFTRLSYKREDLPVFVRDRQGKWENIRKEKSKIEISNAADRLPIKRTDLINRIQKDSPQYGDSDLKKFKELMESVRAHIPAVSNLYAELNQLFSDYVQCLCASADVLWIEDYRELFWQIMGQIKAFVLDINVWDSYGRGLGDRDAWEKARSYMEIIGNLIRALHKQTSHISTSTKLFFREQETHFGYTAQHDLVLHAYYDIIKHLLEYIYQYSNTSVQSALYPLVNFQPDNRINSVIYTEERAELYLKNRKLNPRIMVIHIPLDGMANLMHYLPMLIHEVYHYAAPKDREGRNRILTKLVVYQTLHYSFSFHFQSLLEKYATEKGKIGLKELDPNHDLERRFHKLLDSTIFNFVEGHENDIYDGLETYFFAYEQEGLTEEELEKLRQASILRNWFLLWMENWLNDDNAIEGRHKKQNRSIKKYENYSDIFEDLFPVIHDALESESSRVESIAKGDFQPYAIYYVAIKQMKTQLQDAIKGPEQDSEVVDSIVQSIAVKSQDYINSDDYQRLLMRVDEIFPDVAMVSHSGMPASGYMLQIALDLDKQLCYCEDSVIDSIRFGAILYWILENRETAGKDQQKLLEDELRQFRKLYIASYNLETSSFKSADDNREVRADTWCAAFRNMYYAYSGKNGVSSFAGMKSWIRVLIENQMVPCLKLVGELEINRKKLFEEPYNTYLNILGKSGKDGPNQRALFDLSIQTILKFQRYLPLKQLNAKLQTKKKEKAEEEKSTMVSGFSFAQYESVVLSSDHYYSTIELALYRLYQYREQEGLSKATGMWYRGVSNAAYPILPSGFVHFAEDVGLLGGSFDLDHPYSYRDVQRHHYEAFRYSAEGSSPDIMPAQYQCTFNYLTLMQHYSQHTNLLDWSEDFFASTYFALEDEINLNEKYPYERVGKIKDDYLKNHDADAALYILDPIRFNRACEEIEEDLKVLPSKSEIVEKGNRVRIPNLSIAENQKCFEEYHDLYSIYDNPGVLTLLPSARLSRDNLPNISLLHIKQHINTASGNIAHLPRAVYAAKLNSRIRAQSGLFVAFSLRSIPAIWKDVPVKTDGINTGLFNYQALEQIQNYYLSLPDKHPFLMKIIIPSNIKEGLGKLFYHFGLSKERIYPELENHRHR